MAVATASFWPTVREHWHRAGFRVALIGVTGVVVVAPVVSFAWATAHEGGVQRLLRWEHLALVAFLPVTVAWSAVRLPWNPVKASSRGLIFVVALYPLIGATASPIAAIMVGDHVPPRCVAVALWPVYLAAGLGLCCGA